MDDEIRVTSGVILASEQPRTRRETQVWYAQSYIYRVARTIMVGKGLLVTRVGQSIDIHQEELERLLASSWELASHDSVIQYHSFTPTKSPKCKSIVFIAVFFDICIID